MSLPTVVNWIKAERLKAHRTPGGHRRIARDELVGFIRRHGMPMPPELAQESGRARVLVADARPAQAEALASLVGRAGWEAVVAHDAFSAGLIAGATRPDVVLLDASLPGGEAARVVQSLRGRPETAGIAVVTVSRGRSEGRRDAAGIAGAVRRPLDFEALRRAVEQALRLRRAG